VTNRETPIKKKLSVVEQVDLLPCIREVDEMLLGEATTADVARVIQRDRGLLTDVKEGTLAKALGQRRRDLLLAVSQEAREFAPESAAMQDAIVPRIPGAIARGAYERMQTGVDDIIELESMYLSVRDRIGAIMQWEQENERFHGDLHKDFSVATKMIELHAKLKNELGMGGGDRLSVRLDVTGMKSKFGATIAEVFAKPESRHRVLSLIDQLKKVGQVPNVIDAEPSGTT
jgi:hypothetical protein